MNEFLIVGVTATVVAVAIMFFRARSDAQGKQAPPHIHDALMKRAEAYTDRSPFLKKVCSEYKANGHISNRQADAVAKAIRRLK